MPIYEYRCAACQRKFSVWWPSMSAVDERKTRCDRCGSPNISRLMSRVRVLRHAGAESAPAGGGDSDEAMLREMESLDENDPRALGRFMRKMAQETGEGLGDEFEEVVGRLEKGEAPEAIEEKMGEVFGEEQAGGMGEDDGMGAAPPAPAPVDAPVKAEAKAHRAVGPKRPAKPRGSKATPARTRTSAAKSSRKR